MQQDRDCHFTALGNTLRTCLLNRPDREDGMLLGPLPLYEELITNSIVLKPRPNYLVQLS